MFIEWRNEVNPLCLLCDISSLDRHSVLTSGFLYDELYLSFLPVILYGQEELVGNFIRCNGLPQFFPYFQYRSH